MSNRVLRINGQPSLITKAQRKLIWLSLPDLIPICKYYTRSNFIQTLGTGSLMIIDKNTVSCITVSLPPLNLSLYKQDILDWQPTGGVCLSMIMILYDKHTINFYERGQNLKKTWTIQVMQEITQIKSSPLEKVLGMRVNEKKNTIFLWNLHDISNKPFQQITISQSIVKWEFYSKDMLAILTSKEFQVYYPQDGQYNLSFFIEFAHISVDFCFLDRPKTNEHSGRRTVYPVAILGAHGKMFIYQLYDIDKRIKNSVGNITSTIQIQQNTKSIICGYERQNSQVIICAESSSGKPFCFSLNNHFVLKKEWDFLPELDTENSQLTQYCNDIICTEDNKEGGEGKTYKLYRIKGKEEFEFINKYEYNGFAILGTSNLFVFAKDNLIIYPKSLDFKEQTIINNIKAPSNLFLLEQKKNIIFFISGIKIFRLDVDSKLFKATGFTVKNDKWKLVEVRTETKSLLYKMSEEYILMQYQIPQKAQVQTQKITVNTIKSSQNPLISLRNQRWIQKKIDKLVIGQGSIVLVQFDLAKFFKLLTQQNTLLQYNVFWTTHDGILLMVKNYIFVLQLIESTDGYSITPVKRSNNYLHIRLNPDIKDLNILDARNIVIKEGKRIMKLGNKFGNFVSEDPYQLPDTLLRRQLLMRKMYPPHHPKIIQYLIQLGYFNLLQKLFDHLWKWAQQNGTMSQLYQKIGLDFYKEYNYGANEESAFNQVKKTKGLDDQQDETMKKLCQLILQSPHIFNLQQNGSLILQSQIQALIFKQQNERSVDSYSSVILTQFKTFEAKNECFNTMHIAYMLHSINKQQAIGILRQEKAEIDWEWMKKYSIVMWYQNKNDLLKWAEEIGTNLFKPHKDPMDCLFWYTVSGRKNVLIQLFKKTTHNSAQHNAMHTFLQRNFTEPKHQSAAVKNAYVLIDKKRYFHALAFFIYGQKLDEAISLCLNKLKDINLAFLICNLHDDTVNRNKLIELLINEGDVWAKHIAFFYKNQHIDSFNCLFDETDLQVINHWTYEPKLANFHPALKQFVEMIQNSIPVKRQLQEQQMKKNMPDSNDIFASFYEQDTQTKVEELNLQKKQLMPNYQQIRKQSIAYFIRNNCSILALMLDSENKRAKRSYDLCQFMLTKEVNETIVELIKEMEDYESIIKAQARKGESIKSVLVKFADNFKKILNGFWFTSILVTEKSKIGQIMHFSYLGEKIITKINSNEIRIENDCEDIMKNISLLVEVGKILLVIELQIYEKMQDFARQFINYVTHSQSMSEGQWRSECWEIIKSHYDKTSEVKKNKKQNLYDAFEQMIYKYTYKKSETNTQNTYFKLSIQQATPIFIKKICLETFGSLLHEIDENSQAFKILQRMFQSANFILHKWVQQKGWEELCKQFASMFNDGVSSKLKLHYLPEYLNESFESLCRGLTLIRSKTKKPNQIQQKDIGRQVNKQKINKNQVVEIFRNKQQSPKYFAINKNDGLGMELALVTKRAVKKLQVCESLVNRNRSQDGITLVHEDNYYNLDGEFSFANMFNSSHPFIIEKFLNGILQNRKEYDGLGIIKGSTKRTTPEYLKSLDSLPFYQINDINCIECHHYLPVYMLGSKSCIELCTFAENKHYNRIKCPGLGDIVKVKSYEQRVNALDNYGNLGSFCFDSKISGNCVFALKKAGVIDFCPITPTTYGFITNSSIQVVDSLLHPKRQTVFKVQTNQAPVAVEYFNKTKLAVCRKSDILFYDIRMDIQEQNRDLGGKAKCMVSNYKNCILVGKTDNKVRVLDLTSSGSEHDYDVKCISSYRLGDNAIDKASIEDIQIMGKLAITLNSEGTISIFSIQ